MNSGEGTEGPFSSEGMEMLSGSCSRACLAAAVGLCVVTGLARAQDDPPTATQVAPPVVTGTELAPDAAKPQTNPGWFQARLQRHGMGCWAHVNSMGCGSLKQECTFIFGSCRQFFGEPCLQPPPDDPYSQWRGRGGCGCR